MIGLLPSLVPWVHPITGGLTILLAVHGARLALRSRRPGAAAAACRARHRALMPWVYGLVLLSWGLGLATVHWGRLNLETAASGHFDVGTAIVVLFTAGAIVSRWVPVAEHARAVHPWIGAAALLLCGVQVFLGLQIMAR